MASDVLTTLCNTCHAQPPKYKCPACGTRTCSLPCTQKHKARADCDGQRNPRAFIPVTQLRTAAGIDHDYNFISSIERARQRAEKDLIEVRRLLSDQELRPRDEEKQFRKVWYGDELRHFPVAAVAAEEKGYGREDGMKAVEGFDRQVRRRLRQLDVEAVMMPKGMTRQKENATSWNQRTKSVNWQVEWCISGLEGLGEGAPVRILRKTLEGKPLNEALVATMEWRKGQLDRQRREEVEGEESDEETLPKKKRKNHGRKRKVQEAASSAAVQDPTSTAWIPSEYTLQSSLTGAWSQTSSAAFVPKTAGEEAVGFTSWQFFLLQPARPLAPTKATMLIPVSPTETLAEALAGRTVVEFPTIYVFPPSGALPDGFALGPTERRKRKMEEPEEESGQQPPRKRQAAERDRTRTRGKWEPRGGRGGARGGKKARFQRQPIAPQAETLDDAEEGEINSEGDDVDVDLKVEAGYKVAMAIAADVPGATNAPKGLVDYGSSGDSE